jgi:Phosphotransferase enzyme family
MTRVTGHKDVFAHSVSQAWSRLDGGMTPNDIVVLEQTEKTTICRLSGVGISGRDVVAKRSLREPASIESMIYQKILPRLPLRSLHFYGTAEDEDPSYCWMFLEDAGEQTYSSSRKEDRTVAGQWLGTLHTFAAEIDESDKLPDRGPKHYQSWLRSSQRMIQNNLTNPKLKLADINLLEEIVSQCNTLEMVWGEIEEFCEGIPQTLVHGDFQDKNIRLQSSSGGIHLLTFDWEQSGWGVPAVDLDPAIPDIIAYWLVVRKRWPNLDIQTIERLARIGRIFWLIAAVYWKSFYLEHEWVERCMSSMRAFKNPLDEAVKEALGTNGGGR